jgi:hypothetical protein
MSETFEVMSLSFDDLTEAEKASASNNGSGKEYANYIRVTRNGSVVYLESDAMEPEDARFSRDLGWIAGALRDAYQAGVSDGKGQTASPELLEALLAMVGHIAACGTDICSRCNGEGKEPNRPNDACRECGGGGEVTVNQIEVEDVRDARAAIVKATGTSEKP